MFHVQSFCSPSANLARVVVPALGLLFLIIMAAAARDVEALHRSSSLQVEPAGSPPKGKARAKSMPTAKPLTRPRVVRPRIDIDDQISEANRVHDLLRKMSQAAKSLKKAQTKAKQRLLKKAARLNPADLERIAVLKRIFSESAEETSSASSACSIPSLPSTGCSKGALDMHGTLRTMLKGLPGVEDVVMGLDANLRQGQNFAIAYNPDQPDVDRTSVGFASAESSEVVRYESCHRAHQDLASEQPDHGLDDHAGDAFLAPAA